MKKLLFILMIAIIGCAAPKQDKKDICQPYYYHVILEEDSLVIADCMEGRHVASVPYDKIGILDSIFIADNE